jgi:hypothetical protein
MARQTKRDENGVTISPPRSIGTKLFCPAKRGEVSRLLEARRPLRSIRRQVSHPRFLGRSN